MNVLEGARLAGSERVVFAACGTTLYGDVAPDDLPVREAHPHRPVSPFGVSKKTVIDYLAAYRRLYALEFCALALGNVYGPRQNPDGDAGVVAVFAGRIGRGEPVTVFGDGEQTRDLVYVDDAVDDVRPRGDPRRRARLQHRDGPRDVGQPVARDHGRAGRHDRLRGGGGAAPG